MTPVKHGLAAKFPGEAQYQVNLADRHCSLGRLLGDTGRPGEAEAAYRQSITLLESLLANSPDDPGRRSKLAVSQDELACLIRADKPEEAETLHRAAIHATTSLLVADPKNTDYRASLAASHNNLGLLLRQLGRPLEAETSIGQALSMFQGLVAELPDVPHYRSQVANNFQNLANIAQQLGEHDKAIALALQSLEVRDKLATDYPDVPEYPSVAFHTRMLLASSQIMSGKLEEARVLLEPTIAQQQSALKSNPDNPEYLSGLAAALNYFGLVMGRMNRLDEAEIAFRSAVEYAERAIAQSQLAMKLPGELLRPFLSLADFLVFRERLPEAEVACRRVLELSSNNVLADAPDTPQYLPRLATMSDKLGRLCHQVKKLPEAEQAGRRAVEIQNALAAKQPGDVNVRVWAGAYLNNLADTLVDAGQLAEARQLLEQAIMHQRAALKLDPTHVQSQDFLSIHLVLLTEVQVLLSDDEAAAKAAQELAQLGLAGGDNLVATVAQASEAWIAQAAQNQHDAERSPQRRESGTKAHFLVAKALIREAVQRAPDDPNQYMIADLLTTAPEPLRDPDLALRLARRAMELKPEDGMCQRSLGWALWRSGDYRGSIEAIGKAANGGESNFVLAMAQWQLGEKTEARTIFDGGSEWLKGYEQRCEEAAKQRTVKYPLPVQLKRLQAEAAALLGVTLPTVEPAPEPAAKVEEAKELPKSTPAPEPAKEEEKPK